MKPREFYLRQVVLIWKSQAKLLALADLIKRLEEKKIAVICCNMAQFPFSLEEGGKDCLYLTDCGEAARVLLAQGQAVLGYCHEENEQDSFRGVPYLVEGLEETEPIYLERVFRRYKELPWNILETERCYVRESCVEDVDAFYQIYSDPTVSRYTESLYDNPAEEKAYMQAYIQHMYRYYEYGIWTVLEKESGEIIGRAGIDLQEDREIPELGYIFAAKWHGKGLAEEVCRACLLYAKEELGIEILQVHIQTENAASLKLAGKLGFELVGKMQQDGKEYEVLQREQ